MLVEQIFCFPNQQRHSPLLSSVLLHLCYSCIVKKKIKPLVKKSSNDFLRNMHSLQGLHSTLTVCPFALYLFSKELGLVLT